MSTRLVRVASVLLLACTAWYLPWLVANVNTQALWLAVPFVAANGILVLGLAASAVNNWTRSMPPVREIPAGLEPEVAVVITAAGEAARYVERTALSVLAQLWPADRLLLLISDDGHEDELARLTDRLRHQHPGFEIQYHRPPPRGHPDRRGDAKAGNLNSALDHVRAQRPGVEFLETRDADDEVGYPLFLSVCVAELQTSPDVAFVQSIKEARVSEGDPFDNLQPHFFRGTMHARHAANAVFPCGSGLVWRVSALEDIGGFPTWNLVEDLQSGIEALRRGWRGVYLPVVGAAAQHAPEDLANTYKQRGTWALDTVRLMLWGDLSGLSLRQRIQFYELALFYVQSLATAVFLIVPAVGFATSTYPLTTGLVGYLVHFWPFAVALELFLAALNRPHPYEALWGARVMWVGLFPVYAKAVVLAVTGGRRRKPVYRVTRKSDEFRFYWREVALQALAVAAIASCAVYGAATTDVLRRFDLGSLYWSVLYVVLLVCFIRRSWFGVPLASSVRRRVASCAPAARALVAVAGLALAAVALGALEPVVGVHASATRPTALLAAGAAACAGLSLRRGEAAHVVHRLVLPTAAAVALLLALGAAL